MNIHSFKGAIFDLDGTLFDSMGVWLDVDTAFFARRGMVLPTDYQDAIQSMRLDAIARYTKDTYHLPDSIEEIIAEWRALSLDAYKHHVPLKAGALALLKSLKANGIKIAYATANDRLLSEVCLRANGIEAVFDAHAYLSEVNANKDEPTIYLLACERLGLTPDECIVFEDVVTAAKGAQKGGFAVCGVYDKHSAEDAPTLKSVTDWFIHSFEELL